MMDQRADTPAAEIMRENHQRQNTPPVAASQARRCWKQRRKIIRTAAGAEIQSDQTDVSAEKIFD